MIWLVALGAWIIIVLWILGLARMGKECDDAISPKKMAKKRPRSFRGPENNPMKTKGTPKI